MNNRIRLTEQRLVTASEYTRVSDLSEDIGLISIDEGKKTRSYKSLGVYSFPISRPGEKNLNERVYPTKLWENVVKSFKGRSTYGLMDHPEGEGSTKDAWCVWRNLRFSEDKKTVYADAYLFGSYGQQVKEALEAGADVGLSTSGFGEIDNDGVTVNPETYELERIADHVLAPSYQVYGTIEDEVKSEEDGKVKNESAKLHSAIQKQEGEIPMSKKEQMTEKVFFDSSIREAMDWDSLIDRYDGLLELRQYIEDGTPESVVENLQNKIQEVRSQIDSLPVSVEIESSETENSKLVESATSEKLEESQQQIDSLQERVVELEGVISEKDETITTSIELLDSVKQYTNKLKEMYEIAVAEKNGMITATEYQEALFYVSDLEGQLEETKSKMNELRIELSESRKREQRERMTTPRRPISSKRRPVREDRVERSPKRSVRESDDWKEGVSSDILNYYLDLEEAIPSVRAIRGDIVKCKTLIEAQRTYLRLKSLITDETSDFKHKIVREGNTYSEDNIETLQIREGWL